MFIGYAGNSVAYKFLVLKSDVLNCNTIIEIKNAEFFEHIYPLKKNCMHLLMIIKLMKLTLRKWEGVRDKGNKLLLEISFSLI